MSYSTFLVRNVNGQSVVMGVEELLRTLLSGYLPDGTEFDGVKIQGEINATIENVGLTGDLPDTAAGDLAATRAAVEGTVTVDATGQGDVPVTLDGETVNPTSRDASSENTSGPASNTARTITKSGAGAGVRQVISSVEWSYVGDTPSGGSLSITDDGTSVWAIGISDEGPGFFQWVPPKRFGDNTDVVITLAAGGSDVIGNLNIHGWTE